MERDYPLLSKSVLALLCMFGCMGALQAARPYTPVFVNPLTEQWRWKHFPELDGKGVRFIAEATDQRVWAGCNEGVFEYDGYSWKAHNAQNGLDASPVEVLFEASDGGIFALAPQGIYRYDGTHWHPFFTVPDKVSFTFYEIRQLKDGSLVVVTDQGMIHFTERDNYQFFSSKIRIERLKNYFPKAKWIELPESALSPEGDLLRITDILESGTGEIWMAITVQMEIGKLLILRLSDIVDGAIQKYKVVETAAGFPLGESQKLLEANDKKIWVVNTTSNRGISIFDGKKWESVRLSEKFGGDEYMSGIFQSENGRIWISAMAKVFTWEKGIWQVYESPEYPIPANIVFLQNSGMDQVWLVGYKSKVMHLDFSSERWTTFANLSFQCESSPQDQWFVEVSDRVVWQNNGVWTSFGTDDGLMDSPVRLMITSRGQVWAAGSHQGIASTAVFREGKWERQIHSRLSWGIDYRSVFEAKDGSLWFGGSVDAERKDGFLSGLLQLADPMATNLNWVHHPYNENGLKQANVYGIGQSKDGRIWIGGSRLYYFDGKTWQNPPDKRLQQFVNVIYSAGDRLLVGSRYYGLFIFDGEKWENYNTSSGLSGNTIISIDVLPDSTIIVATENDICRFDGSSWTHNIFPEKWNMDFEGGTIAHTSDNAIWISHVPRSWKRRAYHNNREQAKNLAFFSIRYQPDNLPPQTTLDYFQETISPRGNSLISWKGTDFFSHTPAGKLSYSYRIDRGEWSPFSSDDRHTFTSLPGGKHKLEVRTRDQDFNVDSTPAAIEFQVLFPIWRQTWFILLLMAFLTIFAVYEYRVLAKKRKLEILNLSLQKANAELQEKSVKIEAQNMEIRNQRDKLEEMVEQVEKLSKAKLTFFTNISHELRTPLTLIQGPINQLIQEDENLSPQARTRLQEIIRRNAARLLKLISQLLEIRRIEQSALELKPVPVYLSRYIREIAGLFDDLAARRKIGITFSDYTREVLVSVDGDKVEKIITNLLSNAFKHTPEGGEIRINVGLVNSAETHLAVGFDEYFEISVQDNGCGISSEKLELIFDKYYTTDSNITGEIDSGIGLSYVKDLVGLLQGEIKVESEVGKGTTFKVYLPFIPSQKNMMRDEESLETPAFAIARREASLLLQNYTATSSPEPENLRLSQATVLLVEDNPDMQFLLRQILSEKYRIYTAGNGQEGLQIAQNKNIDLIISDILMPEMDGLTFCEKIKLNFSTSHIPVILLTARILPQHKKSGFLKGADDYITKPFDSELLKIRVENLLQQRQKLREIFSREFMLTPRYEKITSPDQVFLKKLVDIMNENLAEPDFNIDKMSKMMYLSHMHFIRKVKQLTGKKPVDLLKSFRMKKARDLLEQKNLSIADVAFKVGFDLPNSFSRAFKKEFNITPTEFVKSLPDTNSEVLEEILQD